MHTHECRDAQLWALRPQPLEPESRFALCQEDLDFIARLQGIQQFVPRQLGQKGGKAVLVNAYAVTLATRYQSDEIATDSFATAPWVRDRIGLLLARLPDGN